MSTAQKGYSGLTKLFHWMIALLFALQFVSGNIMTEMTRGDLVVGLTQNNYYNWHKSLGLVALAIAVFRLINRHLGKLPPWAPTITNTEKRVIHRAEQFLYLVMFVMPISGYIYVMAGGFGVELFGIWTMPNPIGKIESVAFLGKWVHIICGFLLAALVFIHLFIVLRHQFVLKDNLIKRMLPGRAQ